jgi:hypothetical protein
VEDALIEGNEHLGKDDSKMISTLINTACAISIDLDDDINNLGREYVELHKALSIQKEKLGRYNLEMYKTECLALTVSMLLGGEEVLLHAEAIVEFLSFVVCNEHHPLLLLQKKTLAELNDCFDNK